VLHRGGVNHAPNKSAPLLGEIAQFYGNVIPAPNTFLGVQALALPDFLVEIEATAVIPRRDG
jgi:enamine deaminase RidA (YjgF/YER057c/UK114 family)